MILKVKFNLGQEYKGVLCIQLWIMTVWLIEEALKLSSIQ